MISEDLKTAFLERFGERVKFSTPLAPFVAYGIGGPADALVFPTHEGELDWIRLNSQRHSVPVTVIGSGTNLLVRDGGIRGVTVSLQRGFKEISLIEQNNSQVLVQVGAGVSKPELLEWAMEQGFSGLEFSAGVPGTIGGGIFMNAGTKYGSYGDILRDIRVFDFCHGAETLRREQLYFGYREQNAVKDALILTATFRLVPGNSELIRKEVSRIITERVEKQPLELPSCGSTFKNPEGFSAGRLIEKAGLKGTRIGNAQISLKHANFILNTGGAKAEDILQLISLIKKTILNQFGISLECEVIVIGDNETPQIQNQGRF